MICNVIHTCVYNPSTDYRLSQLEIRYYVEADCDIRAGEGRARQLAVLKPTPRALPLAQPLAHLRYPLCTFPNNLLSYPGLRSTHPYQANNLFITPLYCINIIMVDIVTS